MDFNVGDWLGPPARLTGSGARANATSAPWGARGARAGRLQLAR